MPPIFRANQFSFEKSEIVPDHIEAQPHPGERDPSKFWIEGNSHQDGAYYTLAVDIDTFPTARILQIARQRYLDENTPQKRMGSRASRIQDGVHIRIPGYQTAEERVAHPDTWATRIKENERNAANPFIIGFCQNEEGRMQTLYGPQFFTSKRQLHGPLLRGEIKSKEVKLLTTRYMDIKPTQTLKSDQWGALPGDLREQFERGRILITAGEDLYDFSLAETRLMATAKDPAIPFGKIDQRIQERQTGRYHLLYYGDSASPDAGRTGVLMEARDGEMLPLLIDVEGREYIVELKGCGTKRGGFSSLYPGPERHTVGGAIDADEARNEFYRLQEDQRDNGAMAVGCITFENAVHRQSRNAYAEPECYQQGYIIRLSPSTVRASFTGAEVYPQIESTALIDRLLNVYASQLAEHIYSPVPTIPDRSSCMDNLMIWGDNEAAFTAYANHISLGDRRLPASHHVVEEYSPKWLLEEYIVRAREIAGFRRSRDPEKLVDYLQASLLRKGMEVELDPLDTPAQLADKIWKQGMAYRVYLGRKQANYYPQKVIEEYTDSWERAVKEGRLGLTSEAEFIAAEASARAALVEVADFYKAHPDIAPEMRQALETCKQELTTGTSFHNTLRNARSLRKLHASPGAYEALSNKDRETMTAKLLYHDDFEHTLKDIIQAYFTHELGVLGSALSACPEEDRQAVREAFLEVSMREHYFAERLHHDLKAFYALVSDRDKIKQLLTFNFYAPESST